jgi:predicted phage terminase large subunit-like protein
MKFAKNANNKKILNQIFLDREFRKNLAYENITWFFSIYFSDYITYELAGFQKEILSLITDKRISNVVITSFRGSGKSTFCSEVLPIWSVLGKWQKKFILIVCQTQQRARDTLANIRSDLVGLGLLVEDFQPREGKTNKWSENSIIIPKYGSRITVVSVGESIRGIRHREFRPQLVICDDLEDVPSARSAETRDKVWEFVNGELIPAGDRDTRFIFIGNKVHNDSLMMRLKDEIKSGKMDGAYRSYPLVKKGVIMWPGKFPNMDFIKELQKRYASEIDFQREQMLIILPDGDAIVKPKDIKYYDDLPEQRPDFYFISVDPAFTLKTTADFTAIVTGVVFRVNDQRKIYIFPNSTNKRMEVGEMIEVIKEKITSFGQYAISQIYVEGGSSQKGLVQMLQHEDIHAEEVIPGGEDKRSRLNMASLWIKQGVILFPRTGVDELINQILYFGTEKHDDLVDALTLLVLALLDKNKDSGMPVMVKLVGFRPEIRLE